MLHISVFIHSKKLVKSKRVTPEKIWSKGDIIETYTCEEDELFEHLEHDLPDVFVIFCYDNSLEKIDGMITKIANSYPTVEILVAVFRSNAYSVCNITLTEADSVSYFSYPRIDKKMYEKISQYIDIVRRQNSSRCRHYGKILRLCFNKRYLAIPKYVDFMISEGLVDTVHKHIAFPNMDKEVKDAIGRYNRLHFPELETLVNACASLEDST